VGHEFELAPGRYHAKVMVREGNGGRIGSVVHPFDVPLLAGLRTSSPVLSHSPDAEPDEAGSLASPRLPAHRVFPTGSRLFVRFEVYGAARHETTGLPSVRTGLEIRRRDGTLLGRGQLDAMTPTPDGQLTRTSAVGLTGLAAGEYELVLVVNDDVTRKRLFVREPFTLAAPSGP